MKLLCNCCGRDLNAIGQDNMSCELNVVLCEDCSGFTASKREENTQFEQVNALRAEFDESTSRLRARIKTLEGELEQYRQSEYELNELKRVLEKNIEMLRQRTATKNDDEVCFIDDSIILRIKLAARLEAYEMIYERMFGGTINA